jgi:hypothetical protein
LEAGYWQAYRDFYRWSSILRSAWVKDDAVGKLRHIAYAAGWKKFEPLWDWIIRAKRVSNFLPALESVLAGWGRVFSVESEHSNSAQKQELRSEEGKV